MATSSRPKIPAGPDKGAGGRLPAGYTIDLEAHESHWPDEGQDESVDPVREPFRLVVLDQSGEEAGFAEFYHHVGDRYPEPVLMCSDVRVFDEYQGRGLASALYCEAERLAGEVVMPYFEQTPEGKAFWGQSNRPFGPRR